MQALARVGIAEPARQRASTLSGGQQQRAAIARTLVQGAKLLLADEPIASLDPASATPRDGDPRRRSTAPTASPCVVSLHQVEYARRYCPRTIALRDGAVVYRRPVDGADPAFLRELYGAASEELILPDGDFVDPARSRARRAGRSPSLPLATV